MIPPRYLQTLLISGLVVANLVVLALSGYSLYESRQQYELRAHTLTQNLANALEANVSYSIDRIHQALGTVADELERQLAAKGIDEQAMNAYLAKQAQRLPEVVTFRVANADGLLILGKGDRTDRISWADREYFIYHRDHADDTLQITKPFMGLITKKYVIGFTHRYNNPDGSFAGVLIAPVTVDHFTRLLSQFDLGPKGTIVLRDADLGLITRFPPAPGQSAGKVGDSGVSPELRQLVASGARSSTFHTTAASDGIERTVNFHRLEKVPMIVIAGLASQDYLGGWLAEVYKTSVMAFGFLSLSLLSGRYLLRLLNQIVRESNRNQIYLQSASDGIQILDASGRLVEANDRFCAMLGYDRGELLGKKMTEWAVGLTPEVLNKELLPKLLASSLPSTLEARLRRKEGDILDVEVSVSSFDLDGNRYLHASVRDIAERKQVEEALRVAATAFEVQEGMAITNSAKVILKVNRAFSEITGYTLEEAVGKTPRLLSSGRHGADFYAAMWESIDRTGAWQGEIWNRRKSGEVYPEWLMITAVKDAAGHTTHYVGTFTDVTSRKKAEDEIKSLAFYDPLTGLPNRRLLLDRLMQAIASSTRSARHGALLFLDLDNFKTLNDTRGHDTGDQLLQQVAKRLSTCVREGDTVARLGGDEFVVMLEDLSENLLEAATQTETVGEKILVTLNQTYQLDQFAQHSTCSIGVTLFADHHGTVDDLLKRADLAMYQAKAAGRNTLRFFDPQMQAVVTTRATLEADLREAVLKHQFLLYYQAQVDGAGLLTGVEALLRWQHPQRGLVSPLEFIPLAEDTGLILPLGHWVLETACAQLVDWAARPDMAHLSVAVNISARQLHHPDFVDTVMAIVDHSGANPQRLKLELTESLLVNDVEGVIVKMTALKAKGVCFSLDDFGTGYSSLSYLKRLPLDQLKIDQSFIRDILTDTNDSAIAKMVVALAESMGLTVIAEGVEIKAQKDFLAHNGCNAYQGYLFSRPLPIEEFEEYMKRA